MTTCISATRTKDKGLINHRVIRLRCAPGMVNAYLCSTGLGVLVSTSLTSPSPTSWELVDVTKYSRGQHVGLYEDVKI